MYTMTNTPDSRLLRHAWGSLEKHGEAWVRVMKLHLNYLKCVYLKLCKCTLLHTIISLFGFKIKYSADMCIFTVKTL